MTHLHTSAVSASAKHSEASRHEAPAPAVRKLLLAVDFTSASDAALQAALRLAKQWKAELTLLQVSGYADTAHPVADGAAKESNHLEDAARRRLDRAMKEAKAAHIKARAIMMKGLLSDAILETLATQKPDLLVMGANIPHHTERPDFGTTAELVLPKVSCPVMTVGPATIRPWQAQGPVVFATDFNVVTTDAIQHAGSFSQLLEVQLSCLHILPRREEGTTEADIVSDIMRSALRHVAVQTPIEVDDLVCDIGYGSDISYAIVDYAKQHDAQLIVLGVRRNSMLASHVPGQIAYRIISEAPCPVVTIAFEGAEAPFGSAAYL
jgi:nucleotide-binding universal stress UspA family protein